MEDNNIKQDYIEIIRKIEFEKDFEEPLVKFIETFEGGNESEFHLFMVNLLVLLANYKRDKIKADGYDKIVGTKAEYKRRLEEIKAEYDLFNQTQGLNIPVPANMESLEEGEEPVEES